MMKVQAKFLCFLTSLTLTFGFTLSLGPNQDAGFTFLLPAGSTECFYQTTDWNSRLEVEYQVIAGSGLDVGFTLISPNGYRLGSDFRTSDGIHTVHTTEEGDYRLCFDNSFSKLSEKMVYFRLSLENQDSEDQGQDNWQDVFGTESLVEYKLENIKASMDSMYQHLERSRHVLSVLRAFEARDRYLLEDNLWRVSFWSCVSLLLMIAVAATQIYTLRRLFEDRKRVHT